MSDYHDHAAHDHSHPPPLDRRQVLALLGAAGAGFTVGCGGNDTPSSPTSPGGGGTTGGGTSAACAVTPSETVGPFPSLADLIRSDIRDGKPGVTLTLQITVVNTSANCGPVANLLVDVWQCDATGNYSSYGSQVGQTYLRGVQTTDANGQVTFTTVYPGWYQGRATHIHVEVLRAGASVKVTQIAFPESVNSAVYATGVYAGRGANPTSNARDGIFADSLEAETATVTGDLSGGYLATFRVGVAL
jgi:protocatechuate 3,4-dioxygenase beta subunit